MIVEVAKGKVTNCTRKLAESRRRMTDQREAMRSLIETGLKVPKGFEC